MRWILSWFIVSGLVFCVFSSAGAQSFDCSQATAPAEREICASRDLKWLDEELARSYHAALRDSAAQSAEIKRNQKAWLSDRNSCGDFRSCLRDAYIAGISDLTPWIKPDWKGLYRDRTDKLTIDIFSYDSVTGMAFYGISRLSTCGPIEGIMTVSDHARSFFMMGNDGHTMEIEQFGTGVINPDRGINATLRERECSGYGVPDLRGAVFLRR